MRVSELRPANGSKKRIKKKKTGNPWEPNEKDEFLLVNFIRLPG